MNIVISELAVLLGGEVVSGDAGQVVTGFASLREAIAGDLSFFYDLRYREQLAETKATAVLVPPELTDFPPGVTCVRVDKPSDAFEQVVDRYGFHAAAFEAGVHPSAVVAEGVVFDAEKVCIGANAVVETGAILEEGVWIGPGCFVGRGVKVGKGSQLFANCTVHEACVLGERVILHSGVVIGADGFGYEFKGGRHRKVRQAGYVQIDDDVEIGAGTTVDRARFGRTWIGEGTKIDNLVQIGHNVIIGKHCIIVACCAIAGSARLGDYVVMAAQGGVAGHVTVGSGATLGGRIGVTKDIPAGRSVYLGFPALPVLEEKRRLAGINRLPKLTARVKALEEQLGVAQRAGEREVGGV
jgi:UDP-3-O-[3-hydroxymyristoyl] glucosamine N-acyltransferase